MNDFYDKLNKAKRGINLSAEAKRAGRERLVHFMRAHEAVMKPETMRRPITQRPFIFTKYKIAMQIGLALMLIVFLGGGTSLAANNALPGDALYAVKLKINEKLQSAVTVGAEARAHLDAELAAKRLEEANRLAIEGSISADAKEQIEANFERLEDRVEAKIADLKARGDAEAAADVEARFESALAAHARILAKLEASGEANVRPIRDKVSAVLAVIESRRGGAGMAIAARVEGGAAATATAERVVTSGAAEGRITAATNVVSSVDKFLEVKADDLSAEAKADAEARINKAESLIADANAKAEADLSAEALAKANEAFRLANETRVLLEAQLRAEQEAAARANSSAAAGLNFLSDDGDDDDGSAASATSSVNVNVGGNVDLHVR